MKYIATDIDGVLTDGRFIIDVNGNETKQICYRDLDAIGIGRHADYEFIFVSAEDGEMPLRLAKRFGINHFIFGAKDKLKSLQSLSISLKTPLEELIYIGDSDRDAGALNAVGNSFAPNDATYKAKNAAKHISDVNGGYGVLLWVVNFLISDC